MEKIDILTLMADYFKFTRGVGKFQNEYLGKDHTQIMTLAFFCRIFYYGFTIFTIIKGLTFSAVIMFLCAIFLIWLNVICYADSYIHILKREWKEQNEKH